MSQVKDLTEQQLYEMAFPQVWPDGSEFSVYSSPEAEKMVIKHSSGSHIEFKRDGSVFLKVVGDMHVNSSVNSAVSGEETQDSDATTLVFDSDLKINVTGALGVSANKFDLEVKESSHLTSSQDFKISGNNTVLRATEQMSLEPEKSLYIDTKEMRTRAVSQKTESGTKEDTGSGGGLETHKVRGNYVIENDDPKGGITIKTAGYLNLVCAAERVDITGDPAAIAPTYLPSMMAKATYTHIVRPNPGPNPRGIPGSSYFECGPGGMTTKIIGPVLEDILGPVNVKIVGPYTESITGLRSRKVEGSEVVKISGTQTIKAELIFLN